MNSVTTTRRGNQRGLVLAVSGLLGGLVAGSALAAQLEEVVVTAQKREQGLQDVAISVATVSGERMRSSGISKMEDLSIYVPTLQINEAQGTDSLFIRGLGSGINMGFEQSVGMVIDGVFYGRSRYSRGQFLDLERVEVLKGPQGILFGKNTTSGAINITTANPTEEFEGWVTGGYELESEETTVEGAFSGPLTDTLAARFSYRYSDMSKGWVKNVTIGGEQPSSEDWIGRIALLWTPRDDLSVNFKYQKADFEKTGRNTMLSRCSPAVESVLASLGSAEDCRISDKRSVTAPFKTNDPERGEQMDTTYDLYAMTVNWDIGEHTLTSVTGYSEYDYTDYFSIDTMPTDIAQALIAEEYWQFSQELRIASPVGERFEYIAGAYYQDTDLDVQWDLFVDVPTLFGGGPLFSRLSNSSQQSEMWAVFAQGTWNISESVALTLGARYSEEEKEATSPARYPQ
ncbi:MAG: TonB-dependent receptor, partial [Halioglobus sp.]|nr:TonB-dependent receptor [Halioglobus sp.]